MSFVSRDDSDICIAIINKAGCMTIAAWVLHARKKVKVTNEEALRFKTRVAFIRNPKQRTLSAFNNARYANKIGQKWDFLPKESIYIEGRGAQGDYEAFIDHLLVTPNNHWNPQTEMVSFDGRLVPNTYHRLENIGKYYSRYFPEGTLPHLNSSSKVDVVDYREDELLEMYKEDYVLWRSIDGTRYTD